MAFFFGMLFCFTSLSGQNTQDTILAYFNLLEKVPQEKLYLHLDKPFYGAGEKIWFKGYLVNSVTHQDNTKVTSSLRSLSIVPTLSWNARKFAEIR